MKKDARFDIGYAAGKHIISEAESAIPSRKWNEATGLGLSPNVWAGKTLLQSAKELGPEDEDEMGKIIMVCLNYLDPKTLTIVLNMIL